MLKVKRLTPNAVLPKRQSIGDAGYDLYSPTNGVIPARTKISLKLGIAIELPECPISNHIYAFLIISRSSLSKHYSIEKGAGLIDSTYRGEISVILHNHSDIDYQFNEGDRIAQGIIISVAVPEVEEVESLSLTDRNEGGFGSTGK